MEGARRLLRPVRRAARRARALLTRVWLSGGNSVECPCCGGTFRRFLPHGAFARPNVECPTCGSHERQRMLWLYIQRETDLLRRPYRLLHFAPERALWRHLHALPALDYVTADLSSPLADLNIDITELPFEDGSFDVVICSHVLEHVEDDLRAMRELRRVLRPGGWAIVLVPMHGGLVETLEDPKIETAEQRLRSYGQADHVRLYGLDFADRLRASGLESEATRYAGQLGAELSARYVLSRERIFVCRPAG